MAVYEEMLLVNINLMSPNGTLRDRDILQLPAGSSFSTFIERARHCFRDFVDCDIRFVSISKWAKQAYQFVPLNPSEANQAEDGDSFTLFFHNFDGDQEQAALWFSLIQQREAEEEVCKPNTDENDDVSYVMCLSDEEDEAEAGSVVYVYDGDDEVPSNEVALDEDGADPSNKVVPAVNETQQNLEEIARPFSGQNTAVVNQLFSVFDNSFFMDSFHAGEDEQMSNNFLAEEIGAFGVDTSSGNSSEIMRTEGASTRLENYGCFNLSYSGPSKFYTLGEGNAHTDDRLGETQGNTEAASMSNQQIIGNDDEERVRHSKRQRFSQDTSFADGGEMERGWMNNSNTSSDGSSKRTGQTAAPPTISRADRHNMLVIDFLCQKLHFGVGNIIALSQAFQTQLDEIKQLLVGKTAMGDYGGAASTPIQFMIADVSEKGANQLPAYIHQGMTVAQHFSARQKIRLFHPNWPCLIQRGGKNKKTGRCHESFYPIEVMKLVSQSKKGKKY